MMCIPLCAVPPGNNPGNALAAAVEWYAQERISQGKGAEIAGLSRAEFIDELAGGRSLWCRFGPKNSGRKCMAETWVVNASPLILLARIGQLAWLEQLAQVVWVPATVISGSRSR